MCCNINDEKTKLFINGLKAEGKTHFTGYKFFVTINDKMYYPYARKIYSRKKYTIPERIEISNDTYDILKPKGYHFFLNEDSCRNDIMIFVHFLKFKEDVASTLIFKVKIDINDIIGIDETQGVCKHYELGEKVCQTSY